MTYNSSGAEHDIQCMPCSPRIISEMLSEIHTVQKCFFSQTYNSFSNDLIRCLYVCSNTILKSNCFHQFPVYYSKLAKNLFHYANSSLFLLSLNGWIANL